MTKIIWIAALTAAIFSCQKNTSEALLDAQICLNTAAPSQARGCVAKIASDTSEFAYKLRCSAVFIAEGYGSTSSFIAAVDSLKSPGTCAGDGCTSTVTAVSALAFKSGDNTTGSGQAQNLASSLEAFDNCSKSGVSIYGQLSSLFRIGTLAFVATNLTNPSQAQIEAAIEALPPADLGNLIISTQASSCQNLASAPDSTVAFCNEVGAAISKGGDATQIGDCFKKKATMPSYVCPTY